MWSKIWWKKLQDYKSTPKNRAGTSLKAFVSKSETPFSLLNWNNEYLNQIVFLTFFLYLKCGERIWNYFHHKNKGPLDYNNHKQVQSNVNGDTRAIYTTRVARQYGICWQKRELSMVHSTLHIFRNKTLLFVKLEI